MLRLVGGTSVTTADEPVASTDVPAPKAPAVVAKKPRKHSSLRAAHPLDDQARKLILACETGGGTVGELLAEVNSGTEPLKSFPSSMLVLYEMGIALTSGGRSLGLEHEAFATVTNGTRAIALAHSRILWLKR
jgi:hypothetical protein